MHFNIGLQKNVLFYLGRRSI